MVTGNYGTVRPADVSVEDIEILYSYSPNRGSTSSETVLTERPYTGISTC